MDRRERREILGQWGVRDPDPREQAKGQALQAEIAGSPLAGRPIELRRRHFRPAVDSYVASLGGPLPSRRPPDAAWVLERFPADLEAANGA